MVKLSPLPQPEDATAARRSRTPGNDTTPPIKAVAELMAERAKYEKWLQELDAKRDGGPPRVVDRVRADYTTRLQAVVDQLKTHSATLQQHAANLATQLSGVEADEERFADDKAELEIRAKVGEITEAEARGAGEKIDREIVRLKEQRTRITADLEQIRGLLGDSIAPAQAAPASPAATSPAAVDELEFLKSVVGTTPASSPPAAESSAASSAAATAPASSAPPAAKGSTKESAAPAASRPKPEPLIEKPPPAQRITPRGAGEDSPLAMHVTGSNPIVLRTSGVVEQPKTLKCAECSAMNYSSEWYCERCGAELANL